MNSNTIGGGLGSNYYNLLGTPDPQQIYNSANQMTPQQLQQVLTQASMFQDEFSGFAQQPTMLPPGAAVPYNIPSPSSAYNSGFPTMGPSYYNGPDLGGGGSVASLSQMLARLQQQYAMMTGGGGAGGFPGMGGGGFPGMPGGGGFPGMMPGGGMPGMPGGGMGGMAGMSSPPYPTPLPGEDPATYQGRVKDWQTLQMQKQTDQWHDAISMATQMESMTHSLAQSIIQNIR